MKSIRLCVVIGAALGCYSALLTSAAETRSANQNNSTRQARKIDNSTQSFQYTCGTSDDLIKRVDFCSKTLMDIIGGRLTKWPETEDDAMELCDAFGFSERCIKDASRRCAKGIQKTIVSTVGTSVQKVRRRECGRSKAGDILKLTTCIEKHRGTVADWMTTVMARLTAIETQQPTAEKKVNSICCMVDDIHKEMYMNLVPYCPNEAKFMQRIFRGVIDNAIEIICRRPKCTDHLKGLVIPKGNDFTGLISIILRIVFSLDNAE